MRIPGDELALFWLCSTKLWQNINFNMFHEEDIAKLLPKYKARTARITTQQTTTAIWRIFCRT